MGSNRHEQHRDAAGVDNAPSGRDDLGGHTHALRAGKDGPTQRKSAPREDESRPTRDEGRDDRRSGSDSGKR
ncbi:MAG TPA: hypothetical protein VEY50_01490 [Lysobacter sp.]|nr:hypothetical protein [Lysobacter sp.]